MANRRTPAATAAAVLPVAIALLHSVVPPAPTAPTLPSETRAPAGAAAGISAIYPDAERTPGFLNPDITQENIGDNLCNAQWSTSTIRPPVSYTTPLKKKQMVEYGFTVSDPGGSCMAKSADPACYEEDHLISLENGGNPTDPRNLWPEPYNTRVDGQLVGARQKDVVEGFIHDQICFGIPNARKNSKFKPKSSLTLARGQEILAKDWYACYLLVMSGNDCR